LSRFHDVSISSRTMTAIRISTAGGPDVLQPVSRPVPVPQGREVLIRVFYAGMNRRDCEQRRRFTPPDWDVPGLEVSGEIVATGRDVQRFKPGDQVCALVPGGGYAQYSVAEECLTFPVPAGFDMAQSAALPEALMTVWLSVFVVGQLKAHEWLLVHGGTSGIGTMAIQLARLVEANVAATAGTRAKCDLCVDLGAAAAINYREEDFVAGVMAATGGHGADVILDMVGAAYAQRNIQALAADGRLVHVSRADPAPFCAPLDDIMTKRARVTGCRLRVSPLSLKSEIARQVSNAYGRISVVESFRSSTRSPR
jgi:putative PIG3 family NAD(P)H quinone oxidoreductase